MAADDGPGADEYIIPDIRVLQQRGVDAYQHVVAHLAAVNYRPVGEQHVVAQLQVVVGVQGAVVLQGTVFADDDVAVVGPDHRAGPDAGALADGDVAYDVGCLADECRGMDFRKLAVQSAYQKALPGLSPVFIARI